MNVAAPTEAAPGMGYGCASQLSELPVLWLGSIQMENGNNHSSLLKYKILI
jgi:hypothetical protein